MGKASRHREQLDMMGGMVFRALRVWWGVGLWGQSKAQGAAEYSGALNGVGMGTLA